MLIGVKESAEVLAGDIEKLVKILSELIPHIATRERGERADRGDCRGNPRAQGEVTDGRGKPQGRTVGGVWSAGSRAIKAGPKARPGSRLFLPNEIGQVRRPRGIWVEKSLCCDASDIVVDLLDDFM